MTTTSRSSPHKSLLLNKYSSKHTKQQQCTHNTRRKRIRDLLRHLPTFLFRFIRLLSFVICLLPAFIIFLYHYFTCHRIAVYYGAEKKGEERPHLFSRHYLDMYGSCKSPTFHDGQIKKKPVLIFLTGGAWIIGYRMWGCLLARALVPFGILVIIPDYRNFPKVSIKGMVNDVDMSIQWTIDHIEEYGGDKDRIVLVGQSAGAHIGGVIVAKKVLDWISGEKKKRISSGNEKEEEEVDGDEIIIKPSSEEEEERQQQQQQQQQQQLKSTYSPQQLCGFITTSSPHNLVTMRGVFHRHGLSASVQASIFGGDSIGGRGCSGSNYDGDDDDSDNGDITKSDTVATTTKNNVDMDVFEAWSPYHLVKKCATEYVSLISVASNDSNGNNAENVDLPQLRDIFPKLCVIHGTSDKTVPVEEAIEFLSLLSNLKIPALSKIYPGWSHTDPILEKPMLGNHLYHRDIYELVCLWTCGGGGGGRIDFCNGAGGYSGREDSEHKSDSAEVLIGSIVYDSSAKKTMEEVMADDDLNRLPPFDDLNPMLRPICPKALVEIARMCNPF